MAGAAAMALILGLSSAVSLRAQDDVPVDRKGLTARIDFESVVAGFLTELNGRYKLRVTEITLEPGGYVGEHNHVGPGIRLVTAGRMRYALPDTTIVYAPGDFFFEASDVGHTVINADSVPSTHLLFEILPVDHQGPSLIPPRGGPEHH
jgi:quercetin dioxygenase-like cupin family protein